MLVERHGLAGYRALLGLKVIWSLAAIFALVAGIADGAPPAAWAFLSIFIAFSGIWMSYVIRLGSSNVSVCSTSPATTNPTAKKTSRNPLPEARVS